MWVSDSLRTKTTVQGVHMRETDTETRGWQKQGQTDRKRQTGNKHNSCHNPPPEQAAAKIASQKNVSSWGCQRISPASSGNHDSSSTWGAWLRAGAERTQSQQRMGRFLPALQAAEPLTTTSLQASPVPGLPGHQCTLPPTPPPTPGFANRLSQTPDTRAHRRVHSPWVSNLQLQTPLASSSKNAY